MTTTKDTEGPRGFAVLVQQIDDGELHAELSAEIKRLSGDLSEHAEKTGATAKGAITLTLSLSAKANGTVSVEADVKTKSPKAKRPGSTFWITKGGNLSAENPRQARLPLREVPTAEARALPADEAKPARTI